MTTHSNLAILAPIALTHLCSGRSVCTEHGIVAFGSRNWELFRRLDELRQGYPVDVYIYPSHTAGPPRTEISWHAVYVGHVESAGGTHPKGEHLRPQTTLKHPDDRFGHWAVFWEVRDLTQIQPIPIGELRGLGAKHDYGRGFVPEGPILIEHP